MWRARSQRGNATNVNVSKCGRSCLLSWTPFKEEEEAVEVEDDDDEEEDDE